MPFNPDSNLPPAEVVFEAAYWLPTEEPTQREYTLDPASMRHTRAAADMIQPIVRSVVGGEMKGTEVARGVVIDPRDPDLARSSVYNFPGSVFLLDQEWLSTSPVASNGNRLDNIDRHLALSPRELIRQTNSDPRNLYPGKVAYENDDGTLHYQRKANIGIVLPRKRNKGGGRICEMFCAFVDPITGEAKSVSISGVNSLLDLHTPFNVGTSKARYDNDGNLESARRVRSLELLASGTPAQASLRKKVVRKFVTGLVGS